jgi:ubiquinone/menaquinone biosynthesis C-methylase UbiE
MLRSVFDGVMDKRAHQLMKQVGEWIPPLGPLLDLGSGTGHVTAWLERELGVEVVAADVTDIHVVGPPPVLIGDGNLPFENDAFSASLLFFMLAYPDDPVAVLREAARVTGGPVILVQSVYSGFTGRTWHRGREFVWTIVAFHVSRLVGYIPSKAKFSMRTRRFYTSPELHRVVAAAGLRVAARHERAVLPGRALVVVGWKLELND